MVSIISENLTINPGFCGGQPCITGHRIKGQDVVIWHEEMGISPEEIIYHYPSITLADVYAALTYYHDHREEIRTQLEKMKPLFAGCKPKIILSFSKN
jgi:uncharacterized protein (DUF433 family)